MGIYDQVFVNSSAVNHRFGIGSHRDFCKTMQRMKCDFISFNCPQCIRFYLGCSTENLRKFMMKYISVDN